MLRWVSLDDQSVTFLEGAEDLDLLQPHRTETIQIKATGENVTLQAPAVRDAIVHYWQHQQANQNDNLYFRLLTTSERGMSTDVLSEADAVLMCGIRASLQGRTAHR